MEIKNFWTGFARFYISCLNFTPFYRPMLIRQLGVQKKPAIFITGTFWKLRSQQKFLCAIENFFNLLGVSNIGFLRRISLRWSAMSTPSMMISFQRDRFSTSKTRKILSFNWLKMIQSLWTLQLTAKQIKVMKLGLSHSVMHCQYSPLNNMLNFKYYFMLFHKKIWYVYVQMY